VIAEPRQRRSVAWQGAPLSSEPPGVRYLDQRALPHEVRYESATDVDALIEAIRCLAIRGAPAIGIAGAYGVVLARRTIADATLCQAALARLREARPTAINLAWAVDRVAAAVDPFAEAEALHREQIRVDAAIADVALPLFRPEMRLLTHCHTGGVATAGSGTALGAFIAAHRAGRLAHVWVDETRPLLQGARLTLWELQAEGVPATLIVDAAAAALMAQGRVDAVMVGADRIARNGDTANKIGTYALAIAARYHGIPFYVAAPKMTIDERIADGAAMHIEQRSADEVRCIAGYEVAAVGAVENPAFDITPHTLITAIVTEDGLWRL